VLRGRGSKITPVHKEKQSGEREGLDGKKTTSSEAHPAAIKTSQGRLHGWDQKEKRNKGTKEFS